MNPSKTNLMARAENSVQQGQKRFSSKEGCTHWSMQHYWPP